MSTESKRIDELAARLREAPLAAEEQVELDGLLQRCREARRRFVGGMLLETDLREDTARLLAAPAQVARRSAGIAWLAWRPLTAAAAGIVLGMVCTSVVFGYVAPRVGKVMTLLQENFESGPAPLATGMPVKAGQWTGDFAEVVGEQQGVKPETGGKMLRFLRADYEGKVKPEGSYVGDLYRLIDLRPYRHEFTDGSAVVRTSAGFNSASFPERERYSCAVRAYALSAEMVMSGEILNGDSLRDGGLAMASEGMPQLDRDPRSWQRVESELRLPAEAEFLLIHVSVSNLTKDEVKDVFRGHYLDEVRVSLLQRSPLP
jgi:uncharacterized protein YnzC (UPF0291/DUF896 family)